MIVTTTLKKHLLPNLPYLMILWFCAKLGEAYRLAAGDEMLPKLANMLSGEINQALANPAFSFHSKDMFVGIMGTAAIYLVVYVKRKNAKKYRKDVEYGSARWGTPTDIKSFVDPVSENNIILTATEWLTLNNRPKNPKYAHNKNVLIVGGSGSGKTRFWLKPNLMQCHTSYVVTDPKGYVL